MTDHVRPIAEALREIWGETFGGEVPDTATLFDLGGTSLHALQIAGHIQARWGVTVATSTVFEQDFTGLVDELVERVHSPHAGEAAAVTLVGNVAPLSYAQRRLWFVHQLGPHEPDYNIGAAFRISGPLDVALLSAAFDRLLTRHRILRTIIDDEHGEPVQRVQPATPVHLVPEPISDSEIAATVRQEIRAPFDLSRGPLYRVRLLMTLDGRYILVLTLHHLVTDHQTNVLLLEELSRHYRDLRNGVDLESATRPDYLDYAATTTTNPAHTDADLAWWLDALGDGIAPIDLGSTSGPAGETCRARAEVSAAMTAELTALGTRYGATLFMTLFAVWQCVLTRVSGQQRGTVTVPVSGRTQPGEQHLMGPVLNPLPVPFAIDPGQKFTDQLMRVRDTVLGVVAHHQLPVEELVAAIDTSGRADDASRSLAALKFTVEDGEPTLALDGVDVEALEVHSGVGRFDLGVEVTRHTDTLTINVSWRRGRHSDADATGLLGVYLRLLAAVVQAPETAVADFDLVGEAERRRLLGLGRGPSMPAAPLVPHLVAQWCRATPAQLAVADDRVWFSYGDLDRISGQLASALQQAGVRHGDRVAVVLPPSAWFSLAAAGVWRLGAAFVPMDPGWPQQRLSMVLADCNAAAAIGIGTATLPADWHGPHIDINALPEATIARPAPLVGLDTAYVIYTSGTTGTPKGVAVSHHSLANITGWYRRRFDVVASDRLSQVFAPSFDPSLLDTWGALSAGAALHVASVEVRRDAGMLCAWLRDRHISLAGLPTGLAEALLEVPEARELPLRAMLIGGDRLQWCRPDAVPYQVVNVYGPTETTIWSTSATVHQRRDHRPPPIGVPVDNTAAYILDHRLRQVPIGTIGDLYLAGDGVALGYLGRPALTAEHFVPDPFTGGRMYRTGDLARHLRDGHLEFLGRGDDQVKIRGHRIELQEIEAVLRTHPAVRQAVAAVRAQRLVGYVVTDLSDLTEVVGHARTRLPAYAVPDAVVAMDALPLTANGKFDRTRLPDPRSEHSPVGAPGTALERALRGIWSELLERDESEIGTRESFFGLGGHSLMAISAAVAVRTVLGVHLSVQALLANPTIEELARYIESATPRIINPANVS
ncbi:non-ribosomal peptide synthetase [Nocardia suismassiliense]|uniref:non-ribosomal peptide synthetase n=1 Tax=Nocardia suismassiliense TaxID=2077092 RepID=UPI000D1DC615|nr:non-ribosomal peptide synthetase [Nocardia suismassiliense]